MAAISVTMTMTTTVWMQAGFYTVATVGGLRVRRGWGWVFHGRGTATTEETKTGRGAEGLHPLDADPDPNDEKTGVPSQGGLSLERPRHHRWTW